MRKQPIYILEKSTGLKDENGIKLYYAFAARLTRASAEENYGTEIKSGAIRVRKFIATK